MVVEDARIIARDIQNCLANMGHDVCDVVSSGEEAVKKAAEYRPDLVIMDIMLQGDMDGIEAAGEIRSLFDIPVVYLTAYSDVKCLERAKITEPFGYIIKPYEERGLQIIVEIALYKSSMEKKLKESEEWFATTLKSIGDAVIATNRDCCVKFINPGAEEMTGWSQDEAAGKPLEEVFHIINEKTREPAENPAARVIEEGITLGLANHTVLIARDGREIPIDDSAAPIKDNRGSVCGVVLVFRDITERRKAEEKLRKYTREIEQKNTELEAANIKVRKNIEKARNLHKLFLPAVLSEIKGLSMAAYYQSAEELGGDFYNVLLRDNQLLIYLADASGHGLDGAILNIFIKEKVNSYLALHYKEGEPFSPSDILTYLASQYCSQGFPEDCSICIFMGALDLKTGEFTYSNGGLQIAPLMVCKDGRLSSLSSSWLPISRAINPELMNYTEEQVTLQSGSTILFASDGLIEQEKDGLMYGEDRLRDVFLKYHYLPPETISRFILKDFQEFNGSAEVNDDITYLLIQRDLKEKDELFLEMESNFKAISGTEERIKDFLRAFIDDAGMLLMSVHEMMANAVEHGNEFNMAKKVFIVVSANKRFIKISIEDKGDGFNWLEAINKKYDYDNCHERGLGIIMTRAGGDNVYYNEKGNKVCLIKLVNSEVEAFI